MQDMMRREFGPNEGSQRQKCEGPETAARVGGDWFEFGVIHAVLYSRCAFSDTDRPGACILCSLLDRMPHPADTKSRW